MKKQLTKIQIATLALLLTLAFTSANAHAESSGDNIGTTQKGNDAGSQTHAASGQTGGAAHIGIEVQNYRATETAASAALCAERRPLGMACGEQQ